ncbi:hypothetical protein E2C01_022976 [Portunus trituberculatus]|uniref:Uncharacterized protein n=1 Tax=Portunus trituberculatus TaxID=210409 RepID=A0A5B7E7K9_PORTR|nr:hypothetical protein [Portunus trituberculatus]
MDAGLDAWLSKALDARDRGLPIPEAHNKPLLPTAVPYKREWGGPLNEKPTSKRSRSVRTTVPLESQRKVRGKIAISRQQQTGRARKLKDCPYKENPLRNFKQIPIKQGGTSLSLIETSVLTDDESIDEGEKDVADSQWRDACHPLEALCEDQIMAGEALDAAMKDNVLKEKMPVGSKKEGKGKKDDTPVKTVKFTGISAGKQHRRLEYEMSERLSRQRETIPMATAVRRPLQEAALGKEKYEYEYRFLGYKLDLNDGLSGDAHISSLVETNEQQCSPTTRAMRHKEWLKKLMHEMDASEAKSAELQQQDAAEKQHMSSEGTGGKSHSPPVYAKTKLSECDRRGEERTRGSSSSSDSSFTSHFHVHSFPNDTSRRSPLIDVSGSFSPLSNMKRNNSSYCRNAFNDDDAFLDPASSSSVPDCSGDQTENDIPTWDVFEKYPEIIDLENCEQEEQPLGWDGEGALEHFQHEFEKYKAKQRVGAPFWEEQRRSLPSFGFDRAREDKFFVGYDEDGKEVRYTDERFMERRIRENQVLEYQAECRRLLDEQDRCDREQRWQDKQQERVSAAEKRNQGRDQISYVGEKKSVCWKAGFCGMAVELKNLVLENDQVVCVVRHRSPGRDGTKVKSQNNVHCEILALTKKLRLARDKQRCSERQQHCGAQGDRKEGGGLIHSKVECEIKIDNKRGSDSETEIFDNLEDSVGDDNFQEDLEGWNMAEPGDARKSIAEKDNETGKGPVVDRESEDSNKDDKKDDGDGLMTILRTVPEAEIVRKAKKVNKCKNRDDRDWKKYLQEMEDMKRKKQQQEEERCRQVIFSQSLEFEKQEKERKREEKRTRILNDLETMDREMRLLLEDLEAPDCRNRE